MTTRAGAIACGLTVTAWAFALGCGSDNQAKRSEDKTSEQALASAEARAPEAPKPPPFCPDGTDELTRRAYRWCARKDGVLHGPFQVKDAQGQLVLSGSFEAGQMAGEWLGYWPSGQQRWRTMLGPAGEDGEVQGWHSDGSAHYTLSFANGKYEGPVVYWYANGQKSTEGSFSQNKPTGTWTFWHENGQKAHELTYKPDGSTTIHKHWDEAGKKVNAPVGSMPAKLVQPTMDMLEDQVVECYKHARMIDNAEGKVLVEFLIGYAGDIIHVTSFQSDFKHPFIQRCMRRQLEALRFPANPWGPQRVIRSWELSVQ
jgi:hypothetical protein